MKFNNLVSSTDWNSICNSSDVEEVYEAFSSRLIELYDNSFPLVHRVTKPIDLRKPFINNDLRELIKAKHKLEKKFRRHPVTYKSEYHTLRNRVNRLVSKAKQTYFANRSAECKGDSKKTWNLVNDALGRKRNPIKVEHLIDPHSEEKLTDDKDIAECLNNYFVNIGSSFDTNFTNDVNFESYFLNYSHSHVFSFTPISELHLKRIIDNFKNSSSGYDGIPMIVFKENFHSLSDIMVKICNLSLQQGIFQVV